LRFCPWHPKLLSEELLCSMFGCPWCRVNSILGTIGIAFTRRLQALEELIPRIDSANINPDFDPQRYAQQARKASVERASLAVAVRRSEAEIEQLKTHNEQLTTERDAFQKEGERLRVGRDRQLKARCFWLSEKLCKFWEGWEQEEDRQGREMVEQYEQEFSGEVTDVINTLKDRGVEFPRTWALRVSSKPTGHTAS
jgi:hypothetical protein